MNIKKQFYISLIIFSFSFNVMSQECNTSSITVSTPDSDFIVNGDGTVTHISTGLMWKVCAEGLDWANDNGKVKCTGDISTYTYTWKEALQIPQTLNAAGGYSNNTDWRLPNLKELRSIVEYQCYDPAINKTIFPTTENHFYWSSSQSGSSASVFAWRVNFGDGTDHQYARYFYSNVRLVRGGQ